MLFDFGVLEKLAALAKIVWPIIFAGLLMYTKSLISTLFLGYLGNVALAGGSLSICFANITGYSVLKGFAMGMEPICHQAYGARRWGTMISAYRKTLCLLLAAAFLISLVWLNIEHFLLWTGQDKEIAAIAKIYIWYSIPDLFAQAHFHPIKSFLRTQKINRPITLSIIAAMVLHIPINCFLVVYLKLGVKGVALASVWNTVNIDLGLLLYLAQSKTVIKPWGGSIDSRFFEGWKQLLRLTIASVISVCLEWWCYEIFTLLCSLLSNPQAAVAAMGILIQTTSFLYVFPHSLGTGLTIQVGHELGAGQPEKAKQTAIVGSMVAAVFGILACLWTIAIKDVWGKLFTNDPVILGLTSAALPILGLCELGNNPQTTASGILVGTARPKLGYQINFVGFYLVGLPVAALLSFKLKMGFVGLWYGLGAAQVSCTCMMACVLIYTDWAEQVSRSREITQEREGRANDLEAPLLE